MKDLAVLLINPPARINLDQYDAADFPNPTLAYLAGYLLSENIPCTCLDAKLSRLNQEELLSTPQLKAAEVVGITAMTHEINTAGALAKEIKKRYPEKITVIGGHHATALPEETLRDFSAFDYLIYGEGEKPFIRLLRALAIGISPLGINAVSFRLNGKIQLNTQEEAIEDMNLVPAPAYGLFPASPRYFILTARGCIYRCPFCYNKRSKIRFRSAVNVVSDLKKIVNDYRPKTVTITDDTFNAQRKRTLEILDLMIENKLSSISEFKATVHARNLDLEVLKKMKEAGFKIVHLGIESGNDRVLERISKGLTKDLIRQVVRDAKKAGIAVQGLYIIGHPDENWQSAWDTVKFAVKLNTEEIALASMVPYPGTEIWNLAKNNRGGYKNLSYNWEEYSKYFGSPVELEHLSRPQIVLLQVAAYFGLYLYNLRFVGFLRFLFSFRREISSFAFRGLKNAIRFKLA